MICHSGETVPCTHSIPDGPNGPFSAVAQHPIYRDDAGNKYHLGDSPLTTDAGEVIPSAPVGSMWNADWFAETNQKPGPDGMWLIVKTPGGDWFIDGPSNNGNGWTREGTAPNITAHPSIETANKKYHGFLTAGKLDPV